MRRARPIIIATVIVWIAAVAWAAVTVRRTPRGSLSARVLTAEIPAAALSHLELAAHEGEVELRTRPDGAPDAVTVRVNVIPLSNFGIQIGRTAGDPAEVSLESPIEGNVLRLGLTGGRLANLGTEWTIEVPARFSAGVDVARGRVRVFGLAGGLRVWLGSGRGSVAGDVEVDVPRGSLDLSAGVGRIDARTAALKFGAVDVKSRVGDALLRLDGHDIVAPRAPGPGHRIRLEGGDGFGALTVRVGVGDAQLRIR